MAFLNPPDAIPEAMRFMVRAIAAHPVGLAEDELLRLVSPQGLTEAASGEPIGRDSAAKPKTGGRTIAVASLAALRGAGLLDRPQTGDRSIRIGPALSGRVDRWENMTAPAFAEVVRDTVLAAADDLSGDDAVSGAEDLAWAIALLLSVPDPLDPLVPFESAGKTLRNYQTEHFGDDNADWVVRNNERYVSLLRWITYLGFGQVWKKGLVVDPAPALEALAIPLLDQEMLVNEFVERIAGAMPYTDRGSIGTALRTRLSPPPAAGELSPGLAWGLRVLHVRGLVQLSPKSDAESMAFPFDPKQPHRYSHIAPGKPQ